MQNQLTSEIDNYISSFPRETQEILEHVRQTILKVAPDAAQTINYGIPTFQLYGNLVHFAAFKNHIGFYPTPTAIVQFKSELSDYKVAKGSIQFPLDKALPFELIARMVDFRVKENYEKAVVKKMIKICPKGHRYYKNASISTCPLCEKEKEL